MTAPLPNDEFRRLEVLARYAVLDTLPEPSFDRLTQLAARLFKVPFALINLVDQQRVWAKACFGVASSDLDRSTSFCAHTILADEPLVVPDATHDTRFYASPLVSGPAHARFYAGAPLVTHDGHRIGTLCILDQQPRNTLTDEERATLSDLAILAMDELELRLAKLRLETESQAKTQMLLDLRRATETAQTLAAVTELATYDLNPDDLVSTMGQLLAQAVGVQWMGVHSADAPAGPDDPTWHGAGASAAFVQQMNQGHSDTRRHAVTGERPLFLDATNGSSSLLRDGVSSAAWVPVTTVEGVRRVASFARFGQTSPWHPDDRQLLTIAAHILSLTLSRREHKRTLEAFRQEAERLSPSRRPDLEHALVRRCQTGVPGVLVMLRMDGMQQPGPGDHWWAQLWQLVLRGAQAEQSLLYQLGEHHFALLMDGTDQEVAGVLSRLKAAEALFQGGGPQEICIRVGMARFPGDGLNPGQLLAVAGARLDSARQVAHSQEGADPAGASSLLVYSDLMLDCQRRQVTSGTRSVRLSKQETALLSTLMGQPDRVFSREALAEEAWGEAAGSSGNLVSVQVFNLRRKLAALSQETAVHTVRGKGYTLQATAPELTSAGRSSGT